MKNITARHRRFVEQYCEHFYGARAAREAGYAESRDRQTAYRLLQDEDISRRIEERLDELAMSSAEATKRLGDIARVSIGDFFYVSANGRLELDREAVIKHGELVKSLAWDQDGRPKLKLHDAQQALKTILDAHGAFNHKQALEHSGGLDIESSSLEDVMESLTDRAARLGAEEDPDD